MRAGDKDNLLKTDPIPDPLLRTDAIKTCVSLKARMPQIVGQICGNPSLTEPAFPINGKVKRL